MKTQKLQKKGKATIVPLKANTTEKQKNMAKVQAKAKTGLCAEDAPTPITHEMIEQRAWSIWMSKGCRCGQDEVNWHEAEQELRIQRQDE